MEVARTPKITLKTNKGEGLNMYPAILACVYSMMTK